MKYIHTKKIVLVTSFLLIVGFVASVLDRQYLYKLNYLEILVKNFTYPSTYFWLAYVIGTITLMCYCTKLNISKKVLWLGILINVVYLLSLLYLASYLWFIHTDCCLVDPPTIATHFHDVGVGIAGLLNILYLGKRLRDPATKPSHRISLL